MLAKEGYRYGSSRLSHMNRNKHMHLPPSTVVWLLKSRFNRTVASVPQNSALAVNFSVAYNRKT